jgi:ABC-type transport system involved in multi-copper enzyme maturation permease subunit
MKYFAILKDSLRESLDSKVLYVMFGLSTIVIVLVGSLSFKPLAAQKSLEALFFWNEQDHPFEKGKKIDQPPMLNLIMAGKEKDKQAQIELAMRMAATKVYRLIKVEAINGADEDPEGEFALIVARSVPKNDHILDLLNFGGGDLKKKEGNVNEIFKEAEAAGYIKIGKVESIAVEDASKETARYRVTVQGTSKIRRMWMTEMAWLFGLVPLSFATGPLGVQLVVLASTVISIGSWVTVIVGIVITSFFFPNMLRKGTVDLLLVKPVQRWVLLLYKYVGGLVFIFLSTAYAIGGIWLILGIRSGLWANGSLLLIFTLTFFFSILYAISTFIGVLTRSTVTSIMVTLMAYAFLGAAGMAHLWFEAQVKAEEARENNHELMKIIGKGEKKNAHDEHDADATRWADSYWVMGSRALNAISPRTEDLNQLNSLIIYTDFMSGNLMEMGKFDTSDRNWWASLLVSLAWIGVFLGLAALWFTLKDY